MSRSSTTSKRPPCRYPRCRQKTCTPLATEAGHAGFAPQTDDDLRVWHSLRARFGRVTVEHVVSGPGLARLHELTHEGPCAAFEPHLVDDVAASLSEAALAGRCAGCRLALDQFVEAYGREAGDLALRTLPRGGLFIAGGIAPKIVPALSDGRFLRAFLDKAPMTALLEGIPVHVVTHPHAGLLGAAICAASEEGTAGGRD
jgi:glucokinase